MPSDRVPIPEIQGEQVLGRKVEGSLRSLDTFTRPPLTHRAHYTSDEVTSVCPITGQPDWYVVGITLNDTPNFIESKSLKLYLQSFKDDGQFCEQFAQTVAQDVRRAIQGAEIVEVSEIQGEVFVSVTQKPRGGVSITAEAHA